MYQYIKKRSNWFYLLLIIFIVFLSLVVRIYRLESNPPGFFADEASIGYNAYKILHTGKDEFGITYPIFFRAFGDYKLPIPIYANIFSVAVFGLREFSVRFTSVVFGLMSIIFAIFIGKNIAGKRVGLLTGFLMGISPWHIHMSRYGAECIYFFAVFSIAFYFYLMSFKKRVYFTLFIVFLALTLYTYYPGLIVVPLFLPLAVFFWFKKNIFYLRYLIANLLLFVLLTFPILLALSDGTLLTRWKSVRSRSSNIRLNLVNSINTYNAHFKSDFLFTSGDYMYIVRHSVGGMGELYIFQLPLLIIGFLYVLLRKKNLSFYLVLYLLFLYPLGSSVGTDGAVATRSILGILPLTFISGVGLARFLTFIEGFKNLFLSIYLKIMLSICLAAFFAYYLFSFFVRYPLIAAGYWGWQYGFRQIVEYMKTQERSYDDLFISHWFNAGGGLLNFYNVTINCKKCQIFYDPTKIDLTKKQLFALRSADLSEVRKVNSILSFTEVKQIFLPNGQPEFFIGYFVLRS